MRRKISDPALQEERKKERSVMEQWKKSIYTDLAVEERESFPWATEERSPACLSENGKRKRQASI